jgi:hypothetical protein
MPTSVTLLPIILFCDNQSAIALTANNSFHAHSKHIDLCYHSICENVEQKNISIVYKSTNNMTADIFTKALAKPKTEQFRKAIGVNAPRGGVLDSVRGV